MNLTGPKAELSQYKRVGVEELDQDKLAELLKLRYQGSIADALNDLGRDLDQLGEIFAGF
jgi:type I restriction enzyme R subunit